MAGCISLPFSNFGVEFGESLGGFGGGVGGVEYKPVILDRFPYLK